MNNYDPCDVFRRGIESWWAGKSTLTSLGPVAMRDDDGSPASIESALPNTTIRIGSMDLDFTTNMGSYYEGDCTFEVHHDSPERAAEAIIPLDALLTEMIRDPSKLPSLSAGYLIELRNVRPRMTQIDPLLWRADRECRVRLVLPH